MSCLRKRGENFRILSCWYTEAWPKTSVQFWKWLPKNICCAARPNGRAVPRHLGFWKQLLKRSKREIFGNLVLLRPGTFEGQFKALSPGPQIVTQRSSFNVQKTRSAKISGDSGCWAACQAVAWGSSSRLNANRKRNAVCKKSCRKQRPSCSTRCHSPWNQWCSITRSMNTGLLRS